MVNPDRVLKAINAIKTGDVRTLRLMMKGGVPPSHSEVSVYGGGSQCLLAIAAESGQAEAFELLLSEGADITARTTNSWSSGRSMLESACGRRGDSRIVQSVLNQGHPTQEDRNRALLIAAESSRTIVELLLSAGADPNSEDRRRWTPLLQAVLIGNDDTAVALLEAGADPSRKQTDPKFEFWKKSIPEIARDQRLAGFLERLDALQPDCLKANAKPKILRFKCVADCWKTIDEFCITRIPPVPLPEPLSVDRLNTPDALLLSDAAKQVRESLACHNGTGMRCPIVVPQDSVYELLSIEDIVADKVMLSEVFAGELRVDPDASWWSNEWLPIATNGVGDYLVVDCGDNARQGHVIRFCHETRKTTPLGNSLLVLLQRTANDLLNGMIEIS